MASITPDMIGELRDVKVVLRTLYDFSPDAVVELIKKFKASPLWFPSLSVSFDPPNHQFLFEGNNRAIEAVFGDVIEIQQRAIAEAVKSKGLNGIKRMTNTVLNAPPLLWDPDRKKEPPPMDTKGKGRAHAEPPTLADRNPVAGSKNLAFSQKHCHTEIWEPRMSREEFSIMLNLGGNPSFAQALAERCNCTVIADWGERNVKIGADDPVTVNEVCRRLEQVKNMHKRTSSPTETAHLAHIDDNLRKFAYKLINLVKQPEKNRTTLWHATSRWFDADPKTVFTLRALQYQTTTDVFVPVRLDTKPVANAQEPQPHRDWAGYKYPLHAARNPDIVRTGAVVKRPEDYPINKPADEYVTEFRLTAEERARQFQGRQGTEPGLSAHGEDATKQVRPAQRTPRARAAKIETAAEPDAQLIDDSASASGEATPMIPGTFHLASQRLAEMGELREVFSADSSDSGAGTGLVIGARPRQAEIEPAQPSLTTRTPRARVVREAFTTDTSDSGNGIGLVIGARPRQAEMEPAQPSLTTRTPKARVVKEAFSADSSDSAAGTGLVIGARPRQAEMEPAQPSLTTRTPKARGSNRPQPTGVSATSESGDSDHRKENELLSEYTTNEALSDHTKKNELASDSSDSYVTVGSFTMGSRPSAPAVDRRPEGRTVRRPRIKKPEDSASSVLDSAVEDRVEPVTEADSRKVKRDAGRQKAPITQQKAKALQDGQNDSKKLTRQNVMRVTEVFKQAFETARHWTGHMEFRVKFGRICYTGMSKALVKDNIDPTEWESALKGVDNRGFEVGFSDMITTESFDADFITNLKVPGNHNLFSPTSMSSEKGNPPEYDKKVVYEFHIKHKGKAQILSIDAITFEAKLLDKKKSFGTVYLNAPQHSWNARIALVGTKTLDISEDPYATLVATLASIDANSPTLTFDLPQSHVDFEVKRIYVKRETRHESVAPEIHQACPLHLVVTEYQRLELTRSRITGLYRAIGGLQDDMVRDGRLWYTFALVPLRPETLLKMSEDLEVGLPAPWEPVEAVGEGATAIWEGLYASAVATIRRIDDVGYHNNSARWEGPRKLPGTMRPKQLTGETSLTKR